MRMLIQVSIPVEKGNAAIADKSLMSVVQKFIADHKPEAAYFYADDKGQRSGLVVVDMKDTSEIPALAEPWFLGLNASFKIQPVMTPEDLGKAAPAIERAVQASRKA